MLIAFSYSGKTVSGLVRASYCRTGGDSGAPVFSGSSAYGLHVSGSAACVAYFYPIRSAESATGLTMLTAAR